MRHFCAGCVYWNGTTLFPLWRGSDSLTGLPATGYTVKVVHFGVFRSAMLYYPALFAKNPKRMGTQSTRRSRCTGAINIF